MKNGNAIRGDPSRLSKDGYHKPYSTVSLKETVLKAYRKLQAFITEFHMESSKCFA